MKRFALALCASASLVLAGMANAAPTPVFANTSTSVSGTPFSVTASGSCGIGNIAVVQYFTFSSAVASFSGFSDSGGNTWSVRTAINAAIGGRTTQIYVSKLTAPITASVSTFTNTVNNSSGAVIVADCLPASTVDGYSGVNTGTPTVTPTTATGWAWASLDSNDTRLPTPDPVAAGWTLLDNVSPNYGIKTYYTATTTSPVNFPPVGTQGTLFATAIQLAGTTGAPAPHRLTTMGMGR